MEYKRKRLYFEDWWRKQEQPPSKANIGSGYGKINYRKMRKKEKIGKKKEKQT